MPRGPQPRYVRGDVGREVFGLCQEKVTRDGRAVYRYYCIRPANPIFNLRADSGRMRP